MRLARETQESETTSPAAPRSGQSRPHIRPNRRSLSNRFRVLGFTVDLAGGKYFEVLLTSDRQLFAPANADRRTVDNFYSSRTHSGLIASDDSCVYLVPMSVLHAFAGASPRPSRIYYTLISYQDSEGNGPSFAYPPESLPTEAPFVQLAADFRQQVAASVQGIALSRLCRTATRSRLAVSSSGYLRTQEVSNGDEEGEADGEDAYRMPADLLNDEGAAGGRERTGTPAGAAWSGGVRSGSRAGHVAFSNPDDGDAVYEEVEEEEDLAETSPETGDEAPENTRGANGETLAPANNDRAVKGGQPKPPPPAGGNGESRGREIRDGASPVVGQPEDELDYDDGFGPPPDDTGPTGEPPEEAAPMAGPQWVGSAGYADEGDDFPSWDVTGLAFESLEAPSASEQQPEASAEPPAAPRELAIDDRLRIIASIGRHVSGDDGYRATRFSPEMGLVHGIVGFDQASGNLGRLLVMMRRRDPNTFSSTFGASSDALVQVTTSQDREARLGPVDGVSLGDERWQRTFRDAGRHPAFQAAQNELASNLFIDPMLPLAGWLGLNTERALAILADRAADQGVAAAQQWVVDAARLLTVPAERRQLLDSLGHSDVNAFQRATAGLQASGQWDPLTRAAGIGAARRLGSAAPLQVPPREQILDDLVRRAENEGQSWSERLRALRTSASLGDAEYQLPARLTARPGQGA